MDEIFGEENFIATFVWDTKKAAQGMITQNRIVCNHEYILTYAKKKEAFQFLGLKRSTKGFSNPDNDKRGLWKRQYLQRLGQGLPVRTIIDPLTKRKYTFETPYSQEKLEQWIQEGRILFPKDGKGYPARKEFLEEYAYNQQLVTSLGLFATKSTTEKLYKLFEDIKIFTNPKPDNLINFLLEVTTQKEDLILDFFAGSATTAQAVMELNKKDKGKRKFILVQLDEPCEKETEAYKAGYKTIAEICKERIRKVANNIKQELEKEKKKNLDLGFKVFKLSKSNFKQWRPFKAENEEQIKQAILEFVDNVQPDANKEDILYELMLKNGKQLTEKKENKNGYYIIGKNEIVFILEKIDKEMIEEILNLKPQKIIVLDKLFNGNASFKTNIYLQFKDAGVEFKSV
jgi:adenine-specific DNA-methyltransferase